MEAPRCTPGCHVEEKGAWGGHSGPAEDVHLAGGKNERKLNAIFCVRVSISLKSSFHSMRPPHLLEMLGRGGEGEGGGGSLCDSSRASARCQFSPHPKHAPCPVLRPAS